MIIKHITLHNYRQHRSLDIDLSGSLIAVIGPNGSGKSNLLGAIAFGLIGEQPGFKKTDLLTWGQDNGYVKLLFEHNGIEGEIVRSVSSSDARLKYGNDIYEGITAVNNALNNQLCLDKDLLKQAAFIRQAEIDSILFTDPRLREMSFQKLIGIWEAAKIYKVLGEILADMSKPINYDEQLNEAKERYKDFCSRLKFVKSNLDTAISEKDKKGSKTDLEYEKTLLNQQKSIILNLINDIKKRDSLLLSIDRAKKELDSLPKINITLEALDEEIQSLERKIRIYNLWREAVDNYEIAKSKLEQLKTVNTFTSDDLNRYNELCKNILDKLGKVKGNKELYLKLLTALKSADNTQKECPVCGSVVEDADKLKNRLAIIVDELKNSECDLAREYDKAHSVLREIEYKIALYNNEHIKLQTIFNEAQNKLNLAIKPDDNFVIADAEKRLNELSLQRKSYISVIQQTNSLNAKINVESGLLKDIEHNISTLINQLKSFNITDISDLEQLTNLIDSRYNQVAQAITDIRQIELEIAKFQGTVHELENTLNVLNKTIGELEYRKAKQEKYTNIINTLTKVRDWFHYSNGPHTLSSSILFALTSDINRFLNLFSAPFIVEPSDDTMGFICKFTDGSISSDIYPDASMLSGGQKIQLAVSFRFAVYCMFASKLGLLSLDEPTVYLDDANVGRFCDLLNKIKEISKAMNLQIFIATHERSVIPFVDTIIDLSDK